MESSFQVHGKVLARNTGLNLVGNVAPFLVGVFAIPYVIRGLGTESFGILSIAWVVLGYLSFLDLGFGRATTKFVAESLGRGQTDQIPALVWTSLGMQVLLGAIGTVAFGVCIPFLVDKVLRIPAALIHDTKVSFLWLAASLPIIVVTNGLRGTLEAAQRFDLINYVRIPVGISIFLLPAIAIPFGLHLPGIVLLLVLARATAVLAYFMLALAVFPALRSSFHFSRRLVRPLACFGGWVTVSNVVGPLLTYADRFFIGAVLSMAAVTYYAAPYEAITRAGWILPVSLTATLFPAFSTLDGEGAKARLSNFFVRSLKLLLLGLGPVMLLVVIFAHTILGIWLGADFALKSTLTLQILAVGALTVALGGPPYALLQGLGRPDVTAKFHLLELPIYAGMLWFLIGRMGIAGVALAWTLRGTLDTGLLLIACGWLGIVPFRALADRNFLRSLFAVGGFALAMFVTLLADTPLAAEAAVAFLAICLFGVAAWNFALDDPERNLLTSAAKRIVGAVGRAK